VFVSKTGLGPQSLLLRRYTYIDVCGSFKSISIELWPDHFFRGAISRRNAIYNFINWKPKTRANEKMDLALKHFSSGDPTTTRIVFEHSLSEHILFEQIVFEQILFEHILFEHILSEQGFDFSVPFSRGILNIFGSKRFFCHLFHTSPRNNINKIKLQRSALQCLIVLQTLHPGGIRTHDPLAETMTTTLRSARALRKVCRKFSARIWFFPR
jgi:hypothetical protein